MLSSAEAVIVRERSRNVEVWKVDRESASASANLNANANALDLGKNQE